MKKVCVFFVFFSLFVFVSCGDSKNENKNEEPDSGETVTDDDSTETETETEPDTSDADTTQEPADDSDSDSEKTSECTGISFDWNELEKYYSYYFVIGEDPSLRLEFHQNAQGTVSAGEYDLGKGFNKNYKTCSECLLVYENIIEVPTKKLDYEKTFFQDSGTLKIDSVDESGNIRGSIEAKLIQVTIDYDNKYTSTPVEGGECLEIETAYFNTGSCAPDCDGKICGDDGCGGECGKGCGELVCNAEQNACVPYECEPLEFEDEVRIMQQSAFYYYVTYAAGNAAGNTSLRDQLIIGFNELTELQTGTVTLSLGITGCAYCMSFAEDMDSNGHQNKTYSQESGELVFEEVNEGTMESRGHGHFRLVEYNDNKVPQPGGKCYEVSNFKWNTMNHDN